MASLGCDRAHVPSLPQLRDDADIRLRRLPALRKELFRLAFRNRPRDDHVFALLPIHRDRHLVLGG